MMRVGMGYDVHRLTEGRDLILGGVKIDWEKGLLGHSDADVLIHAVMDALLGAAASNKSIQTPVFCSRCSCPRFMYSVFRLRSFPYPHRYPESVLKS